MGTFMESADELEPPDAEFYAADHGKRFGPGESDRRGPGAARLRPGSEAQILIDENDLIRFAGFDSRVIATVAQIESAEKQ